MVVCWKLLQNDVLFNVMLSLKSIVCECFFNALAGQIVLSNCGLFALLYCWNFYEIGFEAFKHLATLIKADIAKHKRAVHDMIRVNCDYCELSYSANSSLRYHIQAKHPEKYVKYSTRKKELTM